MDVMLSPDEQMLRDAAREFLAGECPTTLVREMEKDEKGYPPALWKKAAELGWQGMALPEKYGGLAMPLVQAGLVFEEAGRALAPLPLHSTVVAALTLARHGSEALCRSVLPGVVSGETILTWAAGEEDPRLDPGKLRMQAVAAGGDFVLNGVKLFVDNFAAADRCLVACRTGVGISLFLVDTAAAGITERPLVTLAKDRQSEVVFKDVRVPQSRLVGELDRGAEAAAEMADLATILLCAQMVGAARKDAEMAVEYSKYREAFGQPIGAFQSLQHMCADMLIWMDAASLLTYEALWKMDQGRWAGVEVSQAKAFCNDKCAAVVRQGQTIHGGIGFMMEFDLQLWFRRVSAWTMRLGTSFEHRARIAAALLDHPGRVRLGEPLPGERVVEKQN